MAAILKFPNLDALRDAAAFCPAELRDRLLAAPTREERGGGMLVVELEISDADRAALIAGHKQFLASIAGRPAPIERGYRRATRGELAGAPDLSGLDVAQLERVVQNYGRRFPGSLGKKQS